MKNAVRIKPAPSRFQKGLSLFLISLLVLIGGVLFGIQNRYDPAAWRDQATPSQSQSQVKAKQPEGLTPLTPPEQYHAENLSDKINGKAELYLNAGFKGLESRRFALVSDKGRWMERYLYDMGSHENAFSVYSVQRRKDAQDRDLTKHAYLSANGLFLVHGPYYLEIIAAEATPQMQAQMKSLALAFTTTTPVEEADLPVLGLFPTDHKANQSTQLIAASAFGIQDLDGLYTAMYETEGAEATLFIAKYDSASKAQMLADKSIAYWREYGGESVQTPENLSDTRIVFILDNYEIVAVHEGYLYGVHEATDLDFGLALISKTRHIIKEAKE